MNQTYRQMNALVGRGIGKEAQMQALIAQQRNNRRTVIDPDRIDTERVMELTRRLTEDTDLGMIVRPLPYADIEGDTEATLNVVMQALGLYTFPTVELTDWLRQEIDDDPELEPHTAIEICAGTGWIGRTLGIPTTDAQWQKRPDIRELYLRQGAIPINYPADIEALEAREAIRKYEPELVIASYCTHLYGTGGSKQGSSLGVDTRWVRSHCRRFYHIGNDAIHSRDPLMRMPHKRLSFDWLVTRGDSSKARIYVWENKMY